MIRINPPISKEYINEFWKRVNKTESCWLWNNGTEQYGSFSFKGKRISAHRYSWMIHFGDIPCGMFICHHCDTPLCVRPDHLFLGTPKENTRDMVNKGRVVNPKGSHHGQSKLTESQVLEIRRLESQGVHKTEIANQFGLRPHSVYKIVTRMLWTHI